jgi:SAM-dependent methyltransferase
MMVPPDTDTNPAEPASLNDDFIACWNEILVPKWVRFRHLLSGNGAIHSDIAATDFAVHSGDRVLDIGCGFGETCLDMGRTVGATGEVLGIDCTESFLDIAETERQSAGVDNVVYRLDDAQHCDLPLEHFDVVYSRFGVMFFQSVVAALRNAHRALKPEGKLCLIVWRTIKDNPCWGMAKDVALNYLPPPGDDALTCGPGPFSMADEETTRAMLAAAGFTDVPLFRRIDAPICIGTSIDEAVDYQILVGPSGEIIREAGELGAEKLPQIREELRSLFSGYLADEGVFLPSSTWAIMARKNANQG